MITRWKKKNFLLTLLLGSLGITKASFSWADVEKATLPATTTISTEEEEEDAEEEDSLDLNDPLEPLNRGIFFINSGVDALVVKPAAIAYRLILPEPARESVGNFLSNAKTPVVFANHLLQGNPKEAGNALVRLVINTTVGILGLFDPAETFGFKKNETNFDDTLDTWGVNYGPYLVLPVIGPSTFRGTVGLAADSFTQPYPYLDDDQRWIGWAVTGTTLVHERNLVLEEVDKIVAESLDTYATFRSIHLQQKKHRSQKRKSSS